MRKLPTYSVVSSPGSPHVQRTCTETILKLNTTTCSTRYMYIRVVYRAESEMYILCSASNPHQSQTGIVMTGKSNIIIHVYSTTIIISQQYPLNMKYVNMANTL